MFGNLGKIMKVFGDLKHKMPEMQKKLQESRYSGQTGGAGATAGQVGVSGQVKATVNGKGTLVELTIDPTLLAGAQMTAEMLADMIKAAVTDAQDIAADAAAEAMKDLTGGMDIPGLDLPPL